MTKYQRRSNKLKSVICGQKSVNKYNNDTLAKIAGIGRATLYKKMNDPMSFNLAELYALGDKLGFTIEIRMEDA